MADRYANMSKLWNDALNKFLKHLTRDDNNGSSYFFVDVHVSANSAQQVESASNSKIVQYNSAWDQFRKNITRSQDPLMTRYKQINHSRQGRPPIYAFGINYDGYFDKHAREFMYYLSTIKYPVDPNNRSYLPSRSRWIFHYARQIQLAIANGAAPAVSLTIRNLDSRLSRSIVPQDLDPDIPAFQTNENGVIEKHADNVAYESMDASGNIALQTTQVYHYDSLSDNWMSNAGSNNDNGTPVRSEIDEMRVFGVISDLFPTARECDTGIKTFYFQVKETVKEDFGVTLDNDLWIPFVWDMVYTLMHADRESQDVENVVAGNIPHRGIPLPQISTSKGSQPFSNNIPLSQLRTSGGSQSSSDRFNISNIEMSHNSNESTQVDDDSETSESLNQDINNVDDNSETSESQSIDINVTNINNYVPNDCDSLPIDIDEIATKGQEIETEMEGAGDKEKSQRKRRTQKRERARRNDSIATDRVDDTIASRLKRRRKQLQDDDDDENNQK